jgi:hypothetical protein
MEASTTAPTSHGGILFPLDMFRPTTLAAALAEVLISKVRNILDATVELCRHPSVPLVLAQIHGTVVGDDPAEFWRENQDLALVVSQITPRQCFVYFARTARTARGLPGRPARPGDRRRRQQPRRHARQGRHTGRSPACASRCGSPRSTSPRASPAARASSSR